MSKKYELYVPTKTLLWRISLRIILILAVVTLVATLWKQVFNLFAPFILAYLITAWIFAPLLKRFGNRLNAARRIWSVLFISLLLILVLGLVAAIVYYLVMQVISLVNNWGETQNALFEARDTLAELIARYTHMTVETAQDHINNAIESVFEWVRTGLFDYEDIRQYIDTLKTTVPAVGTFLLSALFFVMAIYFMSADYPRIRHKVARCVPRSVRPQMAAVKTAVVNATFGYLRAQLIISGVVTLIAFVVLLIYGQSFALLFALLIGIVDFIPFFGSGVLLTPWSIILLLQGDWVSAIVMFGLSFVLFLFRKLTEPKIVGNQTGMHPLISLISIYVGMKMAGLFGMLFMPVVWMAVINMYRAGVFDATIKDVRALIDRVAQKARLPESDSAKEADKTPAPTSDDTV